MAGNKAPKISVIGAAGCVGSSIAFNIVQQGLARELMVADIRKDWLEHHAIDFFDAAVAAKIDIRISTGWYPDLAGSDIVIMAAGTGVTQGARSRGGQLTSRQHLLPDNLKIIQEWAPEIDRHCPHAIVIMVTNPADVLNYAAYLLSSHKERRRFLGYALNDTVRFRIALAEALLVATPRVEGTVVGEHGGSMVLLFSSVKVDGKPVNLTADQKANVGARTADYLPHMLRLNIPRTSGWLTGLGVTQMVEAIVNDTGAVIPCCVVVDGEYGYKNTSIGLPVALGRQGVKKVLDYQLTAAEKNLLDTSVATVQKSIDHVVGQVGA
jgi:malate dehydrogenase